jgi:3,4-dihydroxy 2-butanone 4-phosphate synthase / GTP cyclohydrolase II
VPENVGYLRTKRDRMGHDLPDLDDAVAGDGRAGAELPGGPS